MTTPSKQPTQTSDLTLDPRFDAPIDGRFDVRAFGASGTGLASDTHAIQRAIDAASQVAGPFGGTVVVPPGRYLIGTIYLQSNITLHLQAGSRLIGTADLDAYVASDSAIDPRSDSRWLRAMIIGVGVRNVAIIGPGVIDGAKVFDVRGEEKMRGPHAVRLIDCADITFTDVTFVDAANYAIYGEHVDRLAVRGCTFLGGWDGVHLRGTPGRPCLNMSIIRCDFRTGDDSIAGRYWHDTLISHCQINSSCNGIRLIGPATKLLIHGCVFYGPGQYEHRTQSRTNMLAAILLQPGSWDATTGDLDDVLITDTTARDVQSAVTLYVRPGNRAGSVTIERLTATGVYHAAMSFESWAETPIERVTLRDVSVRYTIESGHPAGTVQLAEPRLGVRPLPAWGLLAYRVDKLELDRVRLTTEAVDSRPARLNEHVGVVEESDVRCVAPAASGAG